MPNRSLPELTENTSPVSTDLVYVTMKSRQGLYHDRKCTLDTLKDFVVLSRTSKNSANYSLTLNYCDKRWLSNQGASSAIIFTLPEAEEGYEVGFMLEENYKVTLTPQAGDKITPISETAGVSVESSLQGSSIYLKGYADGWIVVEDNGTWSAS